MSLGEFKRFVGQDIARRRRRKAFPIIENYLPPKLRPHPSLLDFAAPGTLVAELPVTLYWGMERNVDLDGVSPPGIPHWLGRFDWVVGFEYGWADTERFPNSVFCEPQYLPKLLAFLKRRWPTPPQSQSLLAVAVGPDFLLSWQRRTLMKDLSRYFPCISYEAKDIPFPGISVLPTGLMEHYSRGNADHVLALVRSLERTERAPGDGLSVLAAWGAWWPGLDDLIPDRRRAREFASASPIVTAEQFPSSEWFEALTRFDFMLCPLGNGIQAPKMVEAIMMGCIPIATSHPTFVELEQRGMPMLLLGDWEELTEELLSEVYTDLFRRVTAFRESILDLDLWWEFSFPCHPHEAAHFSDTQESR